jgi:hypothetical protein
MAERQNLTIKLLQEMRAEMRERFEAVDKKLDAMDKRIRNQGQAIYGESVLGRYATAEVEGRLEKIEKRQARVEKRG